MLEAGFRKDILNHKSQIAGDNHKDHREFGKTSLGSASLYHKIIHTVCLETSQKHV